MLKTFEKHLKRIASETKEDFHERVRKRIGKRATTILEQRLQNLILLTPQLLIRAHRHGQSPAIPSPVRKLIGFVLTYFYHPKDFLPEDNGRLFGYLDDAYCVGLLYEKMLKILTRADFPISEFDKEFLKQFSLVKRGIKIVIPEEARLIDRMIEGVQQGQEEFFYRAFLAKG